MESEELAKLRTDVCTRVDTRAFEIRDHRFIVYVGLAGYPAIVTSAPRSLVSSTI